MDIEIDTHIGAPPRTPNLPTNIVDFGGFDSSTILVYRGGIPRPIGDFPESLSQAMFVGTMLVGGLGVPIHYFLGQKSQVLSPDPLARDSA